MEPSPPSLNPKKAARKSEEEVMGCRKCRQRLNRLQLERLEREKLLRRQAQKKQSQAPSTEEGQKEEL